jgi:hypothetical protein
MTNLAQIFAAMWVSEAWYESWLLTGRIHRRTRAVVVFDRVLTGRHGVIGETK